MALPLADDVRDRLDTARFGHALRRFETVGSTNATAIDWARDGAPDGAVVLTEYQSEGRGRHGRTWEAQKGQNLMFSVVLRPRLSTDRLGLLTLAASVAVAEAVDAFVSPHRAALKWPNDVLLEGRKTCGMLLESSFSGAEAADAVVLGVGLNVNQTDFPPALADTATSLRLTTGRPVPRARLFTRLLSALERRYDAVQSDAADDVRNAFEDRLVSLDEEITLRFTGTDRTVSGTIRGLTDTGALRLYTADGPQTVHAGEVTTKR
jgi:BirA family biotin operon repressor/biotin-[acetyl-CoA-carboxylase] ligase